MLNAIVSNNMKKQRKHLGLSQVELAKRAGISVSYVSMLERGQRSPPLDTIEDLAEALDLMPMSLFRGAK